MSNASTALKTTVIVNEDAKCSFCMNPLEDKGTYLRPPCNHLYCEPCMKKPELHVCTRCNEEFIIAEPVTIRTVITIE